MTESSCACLWCDKPFPPAKLGGKAKVFCSDGCRHSFQTACRIFTELQVRAGKVTVSWLRWYVASYTTPGAIPPMIAALPPIPSLADAASRAMAAPAEPPAA